MAHCKFELHLRRNLNGLRHLTSIVGLPGGNWWTGFTLSVMFACQSLPGGFVELKFIELEFAPPALPPNVGVSERIPPYMVARASCIAGFCFKGGLCAIGVQFISILEVGDPSLLRLNDLF